ncbi:MAG: hypothetical protein WCT85_06260, partial [Parachlamydiales bacterium]
RINDTFLKHAQIISFFFRNNVNEPAVLTATWEKIEESDSLKIYNEEMYAALKETHDKAVEESVEIKEISQEDSKALFWGESVESHLIKV